MADAQLAVQARIGAARKLLEQHAGSPHVAHLSDLQATAIAEMMQKVVLTADARLDLASLVMNVPWASQDHASRVFVAIRETVPPAERPEAKRSRRSMQNYNSIAHFFTDNFWTALANPDVSADAKLSCILQHSFRLGLRCPSEPSLKYLTSFWLVMSSTAEELNALDGIGKSIKFKHVKSIFDGMRGRQ